jgi:hypothetical protein
MPGNGNLSDASDFAPEAVEEALEKLLTTIPNGMVNTSAIPERDRKRLWKGIQQAVERLSSLAVELDLIALPPLMYNPADPATFAESIGNKLLLQEAMPLADIGTRPFYGSGIYALYYHGDFDAYQPIKNTGTPIYAGKADPGEKDARTPREQGTRLWARLREHADSIKEATATLKTADFTCRYLVTGSGWQVAAEAHLISLFKPIWNKEMKICQGLGKHGDASDTRRNKRSAWDTLHPGRPWAGDALDNDRSVDQIKADIAAHYRKYPTRH